MNDKAEKELARQVMMAAHEQQAVEWHLPGPPEWMEVEKDDINLDDIQKTIKLAEVEVQDNLIIRAESVTEQKLPYKYHRATRHNPPDVERKYREVLAYYSAEFVDGHITASGVIEA